MNTQPRRGWFPLLVGGFAALGALLGGPSDAHAIPPVLQKHERPHVLTAALGPTFYGLNNSFSRGTGRFKVGIDYHYHFSGDFEGPAIGAVVEQSFGSNFYLLQPAFKFLWDIKIVDDLALTIAPMVKVGYAFLSATSGVDFSDHAFNIGWGVSGNLVLANRWVVFLRPIHLDTFAFPGARRFGGTFADTLVFNYDVLVGGGVTLGD